MSKDAKDQVAADMLDSLLDANLADVADLPEYLDYCPDGAYFVKCVKVEKKNVEIKDKEKAGQKKDAPVVQFTFAIQRTMELVDATKEQVKEGSQFSETVFFHSDADKAKEVIKAKYKGLAESQGWKTVGDIVSGLEGLEFVATIKSKKDKDADKYYIQLNNAMPA